MLEMKDAEKNRFEITIKNTFAIKWCSDDFQNSTSQHAVDLETEKALRRVRI